MSLLPRAFRPSPPQPSPPRIMIWHSERMDGHLGITYWPVVATLLTGFHGLANISVGVGPTNRWLEELQLLGAGDAYIFIGDSGANAQPWLLLRRRGVRTVYYNTEPTTRSGACTLYNSSVDELWDFSRRSLEDCRRTMPGTGRHVTFPPILRFVPPGFVRLVSPPQDGLSTDLVAFGDEVAGTSAPNVKDLSDHTSPQSGKDISNRTGGPTCIRKLREELGPRLRDESGVWGEVTLDSLVHTYDLFVYGRCGVGRAAHAPLTFRHSTLLSAQ